MPQDEPPRSGRSDVLPADPGASGSSDDDEQKMAIMAKRTARLDVERKMVDAQRALVDAKCEMLDSRARLSELERVPQRLDTDARTLGTVPRSHASGQVDGIPTDPAKLQKVMDVVATLYTSDVEAQGSVDVSSLREAYLRAKRKQDLDDEEEGAIKTVVERMSRKHNPTTVAKLYQQLHPHLSGANPPGGREGSSNNSSDSSVAAIRCHHARQYPKGRPVKLLFQPTQLMGDGRYTPVGNALVVALGMVICAHQGAIGCKCDAGTVSVKVKHVYQEEEIQEMSVPLGQLDPALPQTTTPRQQVDAFDPSTNAVHKVWEYLAEPGHLAQGQSWYWPVALVQQDVAGENEILEKEAKKQKAEANRMAREERTRKKQEEEALRATRAPEKRRHQHRHNQTFLPQSGIQALQEQNKRRRAQQQQEQ